MSRVLRSASSISVLTLISRVLGLCRDSLMMGVLGAGWSGTFLLVWMVPNLFRRLFGEGALSASFIPAYASALDREGPGPARRLLAGVSGTLITALAVLVVPVVVAAWLWPASGSVAEVTGAEPGGEQAGVLIAELVAVLFPYVIPVCLVAVHAGALNSHRVFALPAAAPIVLNCFWIGGLLVTAALGISSPVGITRVLAWCLLGGGLAQLVLVLVPLWRRGALAAPALGIPPPGDPSRAVFRAMLPTVLGLSAVQANALVDQAMAFLLVSPDAVSYIYLSNRLMSFPLALTSLALATAVFPSLAVMGDQEPGRLRDSLDKALAGSLFFSVPAAVGLGLVAQDLVAVLFAHGAFGDTDVRQASLAVILLLIGLPFAGSVQLHARAFFALGDTATPARIALRLVLVNLALNLALVLGTGLGAAALTLATSLTAMANAAILRRRLLRRCPSERPLTGPIVRCAAATGVMAVVVWAARGAFAAAGDAEVALFDLGLPIAAGIAAYGLAHLALGSPELQVLRRRG